MIKNSNIQRSIVLPKEIANKINEIAAQNFTTFNAIVKQILIDFLKDK